MGCAEVVADFVRERQHGDLGRNARGVVDDRHDARVETLHNTLAVLVERLVRFADAARSTCQNKLTTSQPIALELQLS